MKRLYLMVGIPLAVFMTIVVFVVILPSEGYRKYQLKKVGSFSAGGYGSDPDVFADEHMAYFAGDLEITNLALSRSKITDKGLRYLSELTKLNRIDLTDTLITDKGLDYLSPLERWELLFIAGTEITDRGMKVFSSVKSLGMLDLSNTSITDDGLRHLRKLEYVDSLILRNTAITDNGLVHLQEIKHLGRLVLSNNEITNLGVATLVHTPLSSLDLKGTRITDGVWDILARFGNLGSVNLEGCSLEGIGMEALVDMTSLSRLKLSNESLMAICGGLGIISKQELNSFNDHDSWMSEESKDLSGALEHLAGLKKLGKQVRNGGQINELALVQLRGLAILSQKNPEAPEALEEILKYLESKTKGMDVLNIRNTKIPKHLVEALQVSLPDCHIVY